jgi:hypothetical protein
MEHRRKPAARNTRSSVNKDAEEVHDTSSPWELPHIAELIEDGQITIGVIRPVGRSVAIANDGENTLAMLVRQKGETLVQLLTRLDLAIAKAYKEEVFTDEINSKSS